MRIIRLFLLTVLFALGVTSMVNAQSSDIGPKMRELKGKELLGTLTPLQGKKGLWGYVNSENKFVVKPVFDTALPFEGEVARVCSEGKWGAIGRNGLYVINPIYDELSEFSEDGIAIMGRKNDMANSMRYGLIDSHGAIRQFIVYTSIEPTQYGFFGNVGFKYSTMDKVGATIHEKQFDSIKPLEEDTNVDVFFKDSKWGMIKGGRDILAHKWSHEPTLLYVNAGDNPDFFLARQGAHYGVATSEGKQVAPCYYDSVKLHESGRYFVTKRDGKYGAMSLKMTEIVPPVLDAVPVIGDGIYRVYDGYNYWCANFKGRVEFSVCADVYDAIDHDAYIASTEYPEWAKQSVVEANLLKREAEIASARQLCEVMVKRDYDVSIARFDPALSDGAILSYTKEDNSRYGVARPEKFVVSRGNVNHGDSSQLHILQKSADASLHVASNESDNQHYIVAGEKLISLNEALDKFNISGYSSLYVRDYIKLPNERLMVSIGFVLLSGETLTSFVESDPYMLPVSNASVKIFDGAPNPANESYGVFTFDIPSKSAVSFAQLRAGDSRYILSNFGGFFSCSSNSVISDSENTLSHYDNSGNCEWTFRAQYGEVLLDIEETESYIYLCGYKKSGSSEQPIIVQVDKQGRRVDSVTSQFANSRFVGIKCANYLIYAKMEGTAATQYSADYLPLYVLEDLGDNIYVRLCCAWEDWGGKMIGGCGLVTADGKWIQSPIIDSEDMCSLYNWEFSSFDGDYLIVRYNGLYGVINRSGEIVVAPKYDVIESLENPNYFKVSSGYYYGVIDATGRVIAPIEHEYIGYMGEDMIVARKDGVYGCYDKEGRNVVPFVYEEIKEYVGGMARICEGGRYGFIDKYGSKIVLPFYDKVENFSEDCAMVATSNGKVGFVKLNDDSGVVKEDWVVFPMYDAAGSFHGGLAPLCQGGKYGYINKSGEFVIPARYDFADEFNAKYKIARISNSEKWGVVDMSGNEIVKPIYDEIVICADGYIYVKKDGKCGIFSPHGAVIYPVECDDRVTYSSRTNLFRYGVATITVDGMRLSVDAYGNIISTYIINN